MAEKAKGKRSGDTKSTGGKKEAVKKAADTNKKPAKEPGKPNKPTEGVKPADTKPKAEEPKAKTEPVKMPRQSQPTRPQTISETSGGALFVPHSLGKDRLVLPRLVAVAGIDVAAIRAKDAEIASHVPSIVAGVRRTLGEELAIKSLSEDELAEVPQEQLQLHADNMTELGSLLKGGKDVPRKWQRAAHVAYVGFMLDPQNRPLETKGQILDALADLNRKKVLSASTDDIGPIKAWGIPFYSPKDSTGKPIFRKEEIKEIQDMLEALISAAEDKERAERHEASKSLLANGGTITAKQFKAGEKGVLTLSVPPINDKQKNIWYSGAVLALESDGEFYYVVEAVGKKQDEYMTASSLGMTGRLDQLGWANPPYPDVRKRISWLPMVGNPKDLVQTGDWQMEAKKLREKETITVAEFISGQKDGDLFLTVPAVTDAEHNKFHGGAVLITKQGDRVFLKEFTTSAAIATACGRILDGRIWVGYDRLKPFNFNVDGSSDLPYWPAKQDFHLNVNLLYAMIKSGLWHVMRVGGQMLWHQTTQGLAEIERREKIAVQRKEMAEETTVSPADFFLRGKPGVVLIGRDGEWNDKPNGRTLQDVFALVSRAKNCKGDVITLVAAADHLPKDFLKPLVDKSFRDTERFTEVDQPLRGLLLAGLSLVQKQAELE